MAAEQKAFGVYVHWPFCLSKCPYCDFNSHVRHAPVDEARFVRAFAREIETTAQRAASLATGPAGLSQRGQPAGPGRRGAFLWVLSCRAAIQPHPCY